MFTNAQETAIFSAVGKLSAAMGRVDKNSEARLVDMKALVSVYDMKEVAMEIRALVLICMDALGNKEIIE